MQLQPLRWWASLVQLLFSNASGAVLGSMIVVQ